MKNLLKTFIFLILFLSFFLNPAQAELSVGVGPEHFLWREYFSNGSQALEESGYRGVVQLHWQQEKPSGILFGYDGKLYLGTVPYNGQTLFPPYQPVSTDTSYLGFQNEGMMIFRPTINGPSILDLVTSVGWDHWNRNIDPQGSNQLEEYDILYLKLGPLFSSQGNRGPWIGAGGKFPFLTYENAHINNLGFDQNPLLHPGKEISLYLNAGFRFNTIWEGKIYYDSYRFSESPREFVTTGGSPAGAVYQPQSNMEVWGVQLAYHFP